MQHFRCSKSKNQPSALSQSPLRDSSGPGLSGRKGICPEDKQLVRHQNWFASQSAAAGQSCLLRGIHFCILNPARRSGEPSLFNMPDLIALASEVGVIISKFVQRPSGSVQEEVFEGLGNLLLDFEKGLTPLDPERVNEALAKSIARHASSNKHRAGLSPASVHPVPSGSLGMSSSSHDLSQLWVNSNSGRRSCLQPVDSVSGWIIDRLGPKL